MVKGYENEWSRVRRPRKNSKDMTLWYRYSSTNVLIIELIEKNIYGTVVISQSISATLCTARPLIIDGKFAKRF